MTMSMKIGLSSIATILALGACSKESPQEVSGRIAAATFGSPVSGVRGVRPDGSAVLGSVAADGSFRLSLPKGSYRLDFVRADGTAGVVYPRAAGNLGVRFVVRGGGSFDLGAVRFVGDATTQKFAFMQAAAEATDCEDGRDKSGALCVDDDQTDDTGEECEGDDSGGGAGAAPLAGSPGDDEAMVNAAVPEHNLPPSLGCAPDSESEND